MHDLIAGSAVDQKRLKVHLHAYVRAFSSQDAFYLHYDIP